MDKVLLDSNEVGDAATSTTEVEAAIATNSSKKFNTMNQPMALVDGVSDVSLRDDNPLQSSVMSSETSQGLNNSFVQNKADLDDENELLQKVEDEPDTPGNFSSSLEIREGDMNHDSGSRKGSGKSLVQGSTSPDSLNTRDELRHDLEDHNLEKSRKNNSPTQSLASRASGRSISEKREKYGQDIAGESTSESNEDRRCEKMSILSEDPKGPSSPDKEGRDICHSDIINVQDGEPQLNLDTKSDITEEGKANYNRSNATSAARRPSSPSSSIANQSLRSTRSRKSEKRKSTRKKSTQFIPLKSTTPSERASLLTRGISLFGRSAMQATRYAKSSDNDANSVISELSQETRSEKPASAGLFDKSNDDALRQHLEEAGLVLLKRLIEFLSECPPAPDELSFQSTPSKKKQRGLTLPASAIGWLSSQMAESCNDALEGIPDCYQIPKQQLDCLRLLFKRVTSLRISGEAWPPPHASTAKATASDATTGASRSSVLSSKILSKFAGDQSSVGGDSYDNESCVTSPSQVGANHDTEIVVSAFQRYYHELQSKPDVNMSFFPNATKVVIGGIPPNWVTNLDVLQNLDMFQMDKGCILDINQLFFPSDISDQQSLLGLRRDLSLIDEGMAKDGSQSPMRDDDDESSNEKNLVIYSHLSKLRLSNCAMGEAAGIRGRRAKSKSVPRLPTFSRFPNLVSLNLSQNELFKTNTVFAGLSTLPLLSSINLSYNRLSRMDDIFMYIGNVTELILTGNEISSTRGLDRLFSLERLSLDENKIQTLSSIAGVAKIPFLMNFDLKGNPLESDDPDSCRIKVFNLFREVRCNNLSKNATFRDMQRLLPILDNELATKDELVALKSLTFRQTVISVDSILPSESTDGNADTANIDVSSEITVNMPSASGGIRRIQKNSSTNTAHFRTAGSALLDEKAAGRLEQFHHGVDVRIERKQQRKQLGVKFNPEELFSSIRPQMGIGDSSHRESDGNLSTGMIKTRSFSSRYSDIKDDNTAAKSQSTDFPFSLPSALLADADDDVWNCSSLLDQIFPSDTIVWEAMPTDDKGDADGLDKDIEAIMPDDEPSNPPDETNSLTAAVDDETQISLPCPGQEDEDESVDENDSDDMSEKTTDLNSRKYMFNDIWEQSYRDNVTRNKEDVEPVNAAIATASEVLDFNAAEQLSVYDGPSDYGSLYVSGDLDLYFDSYIFHSEPPDDDLQEDRTKGGIMAPRIQLFKFDRDLLVNRKRQHGTLRPTVDFREQYIGVWRENVLACGSYARSRLAPTKIPKRGFHGDKITQGAKDALISKSRKFIICLSDSALYFIIDDDESSHETTGEERTFPSRIPSTSTFSDAHWPHAMVRHPLECLRGITIGFQFQRLILRFCVGSAASSPSLEYTYVILTSNKLQTVSILQKIQSHVTDSQIGMGALIDNDDKTFLDALGATRSNEDVVHYQILHQIWKRGDRVASRRAFILTDAKVYLLDETYNGDGTKPEDEKDKLKKLGDISFAIIDSARLSRVTEVRAANEDPRKITLVILPQSKLKRSHRWRLVCNDGEGAERLIDAVRKAMTAMA